MDIKTIVENGKKWNKEWMETLGVGGWLEKNYKIIHRRSKEFLYMSCEITAAAIRNKSGLGTEWNFVDIDSFQKAKEQSSIFQITIGKDWSDIDHIATIWEDHIIQSFYKEYTIRATKITDEKIFEATDFYHKITGVNIDSEGYSIYYWIPSHQN